jgi:hypothetical protein
VAAEKSTECRFPWVWGDLSPQGFKNDLAMQVTGTPISQVAIRCGVCFGCKNFARRRAESEERMTA